jgi:hypothetical protein
MEFHGTDQVQCEPASDAAWPVGIVAETAIWMKKITETIAVDVPKAIKKLARERVGQPKAEKVIEPKRKRKKPKHLKRDEQLG